MSTPRQRRDGDDQPGADGEGRAEWLLNLQRADTATAVVLVADGEVDPLTAPRLYTALAAAFADADGRPIVLDLSEVTFLGSAGLAALIEAARAAERRPEPLRVVVDHNRPVIRPIQITGLDTVLSLYRSTDDALAVGP